MKWQTEADRNDIDKYNSSSEGRGGGVVVMGAVLWYWRRSCGGGERVEVMAVETAYIYSYESSKSP